MIEIAEICRQVIPRPASDEIRQFDDFSYQVGHLELRGPLAVIRSQAVNWAQCQESLLT